MVRRVPGHPDPGRLRHPHPSRALRPQPPQPAAAAGRPRRRGRRRRPALHPPGRHAGLRPPPRGLLRRTRDDGGRLPRGGRGGQVVLLPGRE